MEREWELDRIRLFQLRRQHRDWTLQRLAQAVGRCLSWVKKWLRRFREAGQPALAMFKSQSRAPHHRPRQVVAVVRDAILGLRDGLKEVYGRVVGARTSTIICIGIHCCTRKVCTCRVRPAPSGKCSKTGDAFPHVCARIIPSNVLNRCSTGKWTSDSWAMPSSF